MMKIQHIEVSPFMANCYLLKDEATNKAVLVDPGDDPDKISDFINHNDGDVQFILATHCHLDHVSAAKEMCDRLSLDFWACEAEGPVLDALSPTRTAYGLSPAEPPKIHRFLEDGEIIDLGEEKLQIFFTPGHSPGSVTIKAGAADLITGDTLFAGSIGRTDLPGGSMDQIEHSIMNIILPLGDDLRVHSGHGPATKIGWEKENNIFIREWSR